MKFRTWLSKVIAETKVLYYSLRTCEKCGSLNSAVKYKIIKQNYFWDYEIVCTCCGGRKDGSN